jgi:hypothetical protein
MDHEMNPRFKFGSFPWLAVARPFSTFNEAQFDGFVALTV